MIFLLRACPSCLATTEGEGLGCESGPEILLKYFIKYFYKYFPISPLTWMEKWGTLLMSPL